jgi:hypothetical protein
MGEQMLYPFVIDMLKVALIFAGVWVFVAIKGKWWRVLFVVVAIVLFHVAMTRV